MILSITSDLLFIVIVLLVAAILGFMAGYMLNLKSKTKSAISKLTFNAIKAEEVMGKEIVANDLKVIEGIGPKIESILRHHGINTWYELSESKNETITKNLITDGGDKFRIHDPVSWPRQAELAFKGEWKELKEYQDFLQGGKEQHT